MQQKQLRRLFFDCETSPNVVYSWRVGYKISLSYENIIEERKLICIGYKWQGDSKTHVLQWDEKQDDRALVKAFIPILESADEVVAHYGDRFDLPWIRARAAFHGFSVSPYIKTIDTKAQSSRLFYFNSNRLDYLAQYLGIGEKIDTDFELWKRVVAGEKKALAEMVNYCKHDVVLLEQVYLRLEEYNKPKTHLGVLLGGQKRDCPWCGSIQTQRRGTRVTEKGFVNQIMSCSDCRKSFTVAASAVKGAEAEVFKG